MVVSPILSAVPLDAQLIFVGDEDQLPSVGPGQVFKDLIESKAIPRVNLTEVYRQQDGSSIIELAHRMKLGQKIDITQRFHDRSFINCQANQIPTVVEKLLVLLIKGILWLIFKCLHQCIKEMPVLNV